MNNSISLSRMRKKHNKIAAVRRATSKLYDLRLALNYAKECMALS